jgi:hypothetical protein
MLDSRFRNVFSGIGQLAGMPPTPSPTTQTGAELDPMGVPIELRRSETGDNPFGNAPPPPNNDPEDRAYKAFLDLVNNFPVRKEPSTLRKIGASVAALSGNPDTVEHALYPTYEREVSDWKQKAGVTGNLAQIEAGRNSAAIRDEYNRLTNEWRLLESKRKSDEGEGRLEQGNRRLEQGDRRLDIQAGALDLRKKVGEGAKGIRVNQNTGQTYLWYGDGHIETIDQQDLSFAQRQKLAQAGKLEILDLQQGFTRERDATQHEYTLEEIAERLSQKDGNASETQLKQRKLNRAGEWARTHPQAADWIEIDPDNGLIQIIPPKSYFRDKSKDAEIIADFNKYIDEKEVPTKVPGAIPGNNTGSIGGSRFNRNTPAPKAAQPTITVGATPPPIEKRKVGDKHTWNSGPSNGKTGTWTGTGWDLGGK